jgi:PilZ domain
MMIVVSMPAGGPARLEINDLVSVTLTSLDADEGAATASEVPSRIEDVRTHRKTGAIEGFVIAAPRFLGNLDIPAVGEELFLQWLSPRGIWLLPVCFESQEMLGSGLQVWHVEVAGAPRREERRRFVRVPLDLPTSLRVHHDLTLVPAQRRERAEHAGVRRALADLPEVIEAQTINLSEGGLLCLSQGPVLPTHLPLSSDFDLNGTAFRIDCYVVWSSPATRGTTVESALSFDENDPQCETLRPILFQVQLAARRAMLA